jgi:hypothetical protein
VERPDAEEKSADQEQGKQPPAQAMQQRPAILPRWPKRGVVGFAGG